MSKTGFTLMEVMLVVAVASVLAAVAIPIYSAHLKKERSANAQAHLNDIRLAQLAYQENAQAGSGAFAGDLKALGWALPGGTTIGDGPARYEYGTKVDGRSSFGFRSWAFAVVRDGRRSQKVLYNLIEIDLNSGAIGAAP